MEWYLKVVRDNYANFNGRARRKEFWMFALINFLIAMGVGIVQWVLGIDYILSMIYSLAVFIPGLAVTARRLQDTGKSKVWLGIVIAMILISFIPFIGWLISLPIAIFLIIVLAKEGDQGPNEYGPDPKGEVAY